jgi:hypothetical protein
MSTQQQSQTGFNPEEINQIANLVNKVSLAALDGAKHIANGQEPYKGRE